MSPNLERLAANHESWAQYGGIPTPSVGDLVESQFECAAIEVARTNLRGLLKPQQRETILMNVELLWGILTRDNGGSDAA